MRTAEDIELELLIEALYRHYHYDFRGYSKSSMKRRLARAKESLRCDSLSQIQDRLFHDKQFLSQLLSYLTVSTTEMFRDPGYFRALRESVVPVLQTYPSLKVWIAGCSTGEEVYSMAILLHEAGLLQKTILYATDINPASLDRAQRGIYDVETVRKASQNYVASGGRKSLSDYYQAAYGAAQMDPALIRNVVFSDHSLSTDEVFSEVQFVSCRNVLIYFNRELQNRAFGLFHRSLVRGGFLGLGSKESLQFSEFKDQFAVVNREERVFRKRMDYEKAGRPVS